MQQAEGIKLAELSRGVQQVKLAMVARLEVFLRLARLFELLLMALR